MGSIVPISVNSLIQAQYTVLGQNEDLELVYKGNGKEYVVENFDGDEKYTLSANLVDNIAFKANKDKEDIMNIMFIINNAYESFRTACNDIDAQNIRIDSDVIDKVITYLVKKYRIEQILSYFNEMKQEDLVALFSDEEQVDSIIVKMEAELSNNSYSEYESEERNYDYDGIIYDEDYYGTKVFLKK